jgi:hypothetical protein
MSHIAEKIAKRAQAPQLSTEAIVAARHFFATHPDCRDVYWSLRTGDIEDGDHYRRRMSNLLAGVVAMVTEGIPINIQRTHPQIMPNSRL